MGVRFDPRIRNGKSHPCHTASFPVAPCQQRYKCFFIHIYGKQEALRLAIAARQEVVNIFQGKYAKDRVKKQKVLPTSSRT